jgi:osmotically-inducible protein OsmY
MSTDGQLLRDVLDVFQGIHGLRSSRLFIDVTSRIVTIRGRVNSHQEREAAELAARSIIGLTALVLEVSVVSVPTVFVVPEHCAAAGPYLAADSAPAV